MESFGALAETVAFVVATLLPLLLALAAFLVPRQMRLIWRAAVVVGTNIISGPLAFVLLMELAKASSPHGRPGPGAGIIAVPMVYVWMPTLVASIIVLIALAVFRNMRRRSSS
jgi:hypothetical protein